MKLELKHLAPYLPYRLKLERQDQYSENKGEVVELSVDNIDIIEANIELFKPILRPLSDLTNGDLSPHGIFKTSDNEPIFSLHNYNAKCTVDGLPYSSWIKLIERHFDVFGLIPQGLAIDINTLP